MAHYQVQHTACRLLEALCIQIHNRVLLLWVCNVGLSYISQCSQSILESCFYFQENLKHLKSQQSTTELTNWEPVMDTGGVLMTNNVPPVSIHGAHTLPLYAAMLQLLVCKALSIKYINNHFLINGILCQLFIFIHWQLFILFGQKNPPLLNLYHSLWLLPTVV